MAPRSTLQSLLRTTQAFCSQLSDKETLEYGIAYGCPRFPALAEVNQFREVVVEDSSRLPAAWAEADAWFRARGLQCRRWSAAGGEVSDAMRDFLLRNGFQERRFIVLAAARWVELEPPSDVRVVHARALRAVYRATFLHDDPSLAAAHGSDRADAYCERLDDPPFDAQVALVDGQPAGRCTLYQVGDIGRVIDLHVQPDYLDRGVEIALLATVLTLAKRLALRNLCATVQSNDTQCREWFEAAGFVQDGSFVEFEEKD